MRRKSRFARSQRLTIASGILFIVVIIIILQLWLFTATMNAFLGGDRAILWPAAIASLVCLGLNVGLLWYLYGLD
ncbi:MAG: hypothetical protein KC449_18665 [Anaerolineales bacterium]|jgi:hypothetical protein|nr:hypothetical protein [Anaerolineales bacterium]MCB8948115.1 hypothetical protein [Ardenticatenaceae bacterium]